MESNETLGILLQGKISDWTKDIVNEYQKIFPTAEILVSTWKGENFSNLPCKVIESELPPIPKPFKSTVNFQIVGCQEGLKNLKTDLVMKCRTDQFIHNKKIFELFKNSCSPEKIMVPEFGTSIKIIDYRTSDFCQVGYRKILMGYWNDIPLYDGKEYEEAATYLTKHYVFKIKHDHDPWKSSLRKYFCVKRFHEDFHIEWEKLNNFDNYKNTYDISYPNSATTDV